MLTEQVNNEEGKILTLILGKTISGSIKSIYLNYRGLIVTDFSARLINQPKT